MNGRRVNLRIPGPTPVPPEVLQAMSQPMVNHRGPEFKQLLLRVTDGLKHFYETSGDVLTFTGSGTSGLEAAVVNLLSAGDRTLHVVIGNFGQRFMEIAKAFGADTTQVVFENGAAADPAAVRDALRADPAVKAVFITHNETSTGVTNPLRELEAVAKEFGKLVIVDGVSSVSSIPCETDAWGLDAVVSGSQKGWMIPPGLTFMSMSADAWKAHAEARNPRFNWDATRARKSLEKGETPWTPAISLFHGLDAALGMMHAEGREAIYERHRDIAQHTRDGVRALGLGLLVKDEKYASNTVTAVTMPEGHDPDAYRKLLDKEHAIVVQGGQADLTGKIFRIGHLGWVNRADLDEVLEVMRATLPGLGILPAVPAGAR
jgi:aspartate aminotransferase-like enzyme